MNPAWRTITALSAGDGKLATKTHLWFDEQWQTTGYTAGYTFEHFAKVLDGLDDLGASLEKLSSKPGLFVIRGNVKTGAPKHIQRTYKNPDSWIEDVDKVWLAIDIDGQPADPTRDHVEQAIALMPDWLREADCVWRFSSSHGVKPANQLRLHLWYWLERPVGNNALRAWARPLPIDGALYQPVQPHYTAAPIFIGADDPVSRRLGYHRSTRRSANPPIELLPTEAFALWQEREAERRQEAERAKLSVTPPTRKTAHDLERRYARIVDAELERLRSVGEGNRHHQVYATASSIARFAAASETARSARPAVEAAACAIMPANRQAEALRRVEEGWRYGLANPSELHGHQRDDDDLKDWGLSPTPTKLELPPEGILLEDLFR